MSIGVKDTQEIIRHAAVQSHQTSSVPVALDPKEVGMATGPRNRKRALIRFGSQPDYLHAGENQIDEWQKLDDDTYKFLQMRKQQFARMHSPPSHQFIAEMESQFKYNDPNYEFGSFLGLMRQAADLDQTRQTFVTASERSAVHAFARRLTHGRRQGEVFDPGMVKRYRDLMESNQAATMRGLADLFRLISRAARQPLIGAMRDAPSQSIGVLLHVIDLAARFNQKSEASLEFQVSPMDVFLGARTVLFNRSMANPTMSIVKDLVLDETGLYHDDLIELLKNIGVFGSELTLFVPESLTEDGFALKGGTYSAVELVMAAGAKLVNSQGPVAAALSTLGDAIVHKVQQQDRHKDNQVQGILAHFNELLLGERRSADRIIQERQQVRFDYMTAIQRAGRIAGEMQTGQFPIMSVGETIALSTSEQSTVDQPLPKAELIAPAAVLAKLSTSQYESLLGIWDTVLGRVRKQLTTKSLVFKSLAAQLARVRALDTCLVYGLTPAGARCTSRLAKLISGDEFRTQFGLSADVANVIEDSLSRDYPAFLASLEALILTFYDFKVSLQSIQFRKRDRLPVNVGGAFDADIELDAADLDESVLKLLLGSILLAHYQEVSLEQSPSWPFEFEGSKLAFPVAGGLQSLGNCDPYLAYCAFLHSAFQPASVNVPAELEIRMAAMFRNPPDWKAAMARKYKDLRARGDTATKLYQSKDIPLRKGWEKGCELGFMDEVSDLVRQAQGGKGLELKLMEALNGMQVDIDCACDAVEAQKSRLTRDRLSAILD